MAGQAGAGPVRVVLFDFAGTLTRIPPGFDDAEPWRRYLASLVGSRLMSPVGTGPALDRLAAAEAASWTACVEEGRSTTLRRVLDNAGVPVHDRAEQAYFSAFQEGTLVTEEARRVLIELRGLGLALGMLTNTIWPSAWIERRLRDAGVRHLFDAVVASSDIDHCKPHPRAFASALARFPGTAPREAVFVGDRLFEDIHGATGVGLRCIHLRADTPDSVPQRAPRPWTTVTGIGDVVAAVRSAPSTTRIPLPANTERST